MPRPTRLVIVLLLLVATATFAALDVARASPEPAEWAQEIERFRGWGGYGRNRFPPRYPTETSFDGGFNFCRLIYTSDRQENGGSGWSTDYWDADINFSTRLGELTGAPTAVRITSRCGFPIR
jgi:hypothetical protein